MRVLVTGGAGYIGSVVTEQLVSDGHQVVVYDNLSRAIVKRSLPALSLSKAICSTPTSFTQTLNDNKSKPSFTWLRLHLSASRLKHPAKYYHNNVVAGLVLLDAMRACGVKKIVFSSTAATYGEPETQPILETAPTNPTNPYGETKLAFERAMQWYDGAYGLRYASLRYFNAAGATEKCGEDHDPETHIIPITLQAAAGKRTSRGDLR